MSSKLPKYVNIDRRVNDSRSDFEYLFSLLQSLKNVQNQDVYFSFSGCGFLQQNAVAFLGALIRLLQQNGNTVYFQMSSIEDKVATNLRQNGFLYQLGLHGPRWDGNSIPYREDLSIYEDDYADYLSQRWLGRGWINVSEALKNHIIAPVIEAYINVFDHASSSVGVITCGQRYPNRGELKIALVDLGVGIPHRVRTYLDSTAMLAADALHWAFEPNTTTKHDGKVARGNGLKILKEFIQTNHGKLEIYSDTGYVCIAEGDTQFENRSVLFRGTIVQITLMCDEQLYRLPNEEDYDSDEFYF